MEAQRNSKGSITPTEQEGLEECLDALCTSCAQPHESKSPTRCAFFLFSGMRLTRQIRRSRQHVPAQRTPSRTPPMLEGEEVERTVRCIAPGFCWPQGQARWRTARSRLHNPQLGRVIAWHCGSKSVSLSYDFGMLLTKGNITDGTSAEEGQGVTSILAKLRCGRSMYPRLDTPHRSSGQLSAW